MRNGRFWPGGCALPDLSSLSLLSSYGYWWKAPCKSIDDPMPPCQSVSSVRKIPARLTAAFLCLAIAGCAGQIQTRIEARGALSPGSPVMIAIAPGPDATPARTGDLARDLAAAGLAVLPDAAITIDIGVGIRPAAVSIWPGQDDTPGALSVMRKARGKGCVPETFRVTLSAVDRDSARTIAYGSAEETRCRAAPDDVMPALVRQAVMALVSSRPGLRIVKRPDRR
jgi:hypothetical protein